MYLVDPKNKLAVSEMIGFQPEKIVIAGDSAGANLVFGLIVALNEIKRNYPEYANLKMPSSIVCVYGAFDIRGVMSPSKFISAFDPILHHGNIMAMIGTYAGELRSFSTETEQDSPFRKLYRSQKSLSFQESTRRSGRLCGQESSTVDRSPGTE